MKPQPSVMILSAVATAGALLLGCEGGIKQLQPGVSGETELIAAYVDPLDAKPAGSCSRTRPDGGDCDKLPIVDGDAQDKEWNAAQPLFVYVSGDEAMGGPGFYVELRAIWSDEGRNYDPRVPDPLLRNHLYMLVRYADETYDIYPDYWVYARPGQLGLVPSPIPEQGHCDSVIVEGKNWFRENVGGQEDQVSLMWEIEPASDELGSYSQRGCQVACHGGQFGPVPHGKFDVWTWRAGRTNAQESTVYPDLSRVDEEGVPQSSYSVQLDPTTNWPAYMEDMWADGSGLHHDDATRFYPADGPLQNGYTGQLYTLNEKMSADGYPIPSHISELVKPKKESTGGTGSEPVVPPNNNLPMSMYLWGPKAQRFDVCDTVATSRQAPSNPRWSEKLSPGETDVMPGYLLFIPNGSAADVRAKGDHTTTQARRFPVWTLEIRRSMMTGPDPNNSYPDDVSLDPTKQYTFTIAIFNRSSQIHSGSGPLKLSFAPSLHALRTGGPAS